MPNNKVNLLMAVHCHQPVGNFDWVFREAYEKSYLPFISVLEKHPKIKIAFHFSGCLLDWIKDKRPEFMGILKRLVKSGQVEMMTGGYYEPILPLIPDRDKLAQIRILSDFIKKNTGFEPQGAWLTERVWEPYLARIYAQAGIRYTIVDDSHFELAGKKGEEILGYYLTEEEGRAVAVFPSSKKLRYNMPFKLPAETIDYLRSVATPCGTRAVTFGDDGEKFGLWPQTYKWVYEEKWLENFFKALEDNSDWINIMTPAQYLSKHGPIGRFYIPCASYPEMLEWSGGYFRNFLVKYPEANWMHKRMLYVSEKVEEGARGQGPGARGRKARESLYKAQCNCAYWHGVFGGLYLHHLRNAVYTNLIDAEKKLGQKGAVRAEVFDMDKDGSDEIIMENERLGVYMAPGEGGAIFEIDYKPKSLNLVDTLTRRPEAYHKKVCAKAEAALCAAVNSGGIASIHDSTNMKVKDLDGLLNYDGYRKGSLVEHFLADGSTAAGFARAEFREMGDFTNSPYKYGIRKSHKAVTAVLQREGHVLTDSGPAVIRLEKSVKLEAKKSALDISYRLKNMLDKKAALWFGSEFNLSVKDPEFCRAGELLNIGKLEIEDEWFKTLLNYSLSKNANLWFYPVETVSESESGIERTYQQLCVLFHWPLTLKAGESWSVDINLGIK